MPSRNLLSSIRAPCPQGGGGDSLRREALRSAAPADRHRLRVFPYVRLMCPPPSRIECTAVQMHPLPRVCSRFGFRCLPNRSGPPITLKDFHRNGSLQRSFLIRKNINFSVTSGKLRPLTRRPAQLSFPGNHCSPRQHRMFSFLKKRRMMSGFQYNVCLGNVITRESRAPSSDPHTH